MRRSGPPEGLIMNEQIRVGLIANGQPLPLVLRDGGILLHGESGASPRRLFLEFDGFGDSTRTRMRFVQQREGWHPHTFPLHVTTENGELVFSGVEADTLPPGLYACRLVVDDLRLRDQGRFRVEVKADGASTTVIDAAQDGRQVRLNRAIDALPSGIRRVLAAAGSAVDDLPLPQWLESMTPRASRKACLLNVLAKLSALREPLLDTVTRVFFVDVDRAYTEVTPRCAQLLRELADNPKKPFFAEGSPKSPVHFKLLTRAGVGPEDYRLESYRQEGRNCLQAVVAVPIRDPEAPHFAEFDIDLGNPLQNVSGFVVHLGELANPDRTDHFALRERLLKSPAAEFLCYDVVEPLVASRVLNT
jgi:hypothetical protein